LAAVLAALLTACGADHSEAQAPMQTASAAKSTERSRQAAAPAPPAPVRAAAATPLPDCAPENCSRLRIIDGNAEAYRIDAQRRAALEAAAGNTVLP